MNATQTSGGAPGQGDWDFDRLVEEGMSLIPGYAPAWTNHNASDPGITLIELLAYFTEILLYRLDRIPRRSKLHFLRLLRGAGWDGYVDLEHAPTDALDRAIEAAVAQLNQPQCAVTVDDFERLARQVTLAGDEQAGAARVLCVPRMDLRHGERPAPDTGQRPGHVSLVLVPRRQLTDQQAQELVARAKGFLQPRCMIATRLHVTTPLFLHVSLRVRLRLDGAAGLSAQAVRQDVARALQRYGSPFPGEGPDGDGWPFGQHLSLARVGGMLQRLRGVGRVERIEVLQAALDERTVSERQGYVGIQLAVESKIGTGSRLGAQSSIGADRLVRDDAGRLVLVRLRPYELLALHVEDDDIRVTGPPGV